MRGRDLALLSALAEMWGAVYTFTKAAHAEVSPAFVIAAGISFAAVVLHAAFPLLGRASARSAPSVGEAPRSCGVPSSFWAC